MSLNHTCLCAVLAHTLQFSGRETKRLCISHISSPPFRALHNLQNSNVASMRENLLFAMRSATSLAMDRTKGLDSSGSIPFLPRFESR